MYSYVVSGFRVESNVAFSQMHAAPDDARPDIIIEVRYTGSSAWLEPMAGILRPYVRELSFERVILEHPAHGEITVTASRIEVAVRDELHWEEARTYILGTALAIGTFMRGAIPFHMSSVSIGTSAIGFAGESHAGKSTWAALSLIEFDGRLMTDDVARISAEMNGRIATVWPSLRRLRFREDLGPLLESRGLTVQRDPQGRLECYGFPSSPTECQLRAIFLPVPSDAAGVRVRALRGDERVVAVYENIFRRDYGIAVVGASELMKAAMEIACTTRIYELEYQPGIEHARRNVREFAEELAKINLI